MNKMKTIKIVLIVLLALGWAYSCSADANYLSGSYANIHQRNYSDNISQLQNPAHYMTEGVLFNQSKISKTISDVYLQGGAVIYFIDLDYIPVPHRLLDATTGNPVDYAYRGKIILFGEEYYIKDVDSDFISAYRECY